MKDGNTLIQYDLDWLHERFSQDVVKTEEQREEMMVRWKNEYASDKLPEHMMDTFNFPLSLKTLVYELIHLKIRVFKLESDKMG